MASTRYAVTMAIEEAVDEVQIARTAATSTNSKATGHGGVGPGSKRSGFLVPTCMNVIRPSLLSCQFTEFRTVARHAPYAPDAGVRERAYEQFRNGLRHGLDSFWGLVDLILSE